LRKHLAVIALAALPAIAVPAIAGAADQVIAKVGDVQITKDQLERPLFEGYGLNVLLNIVQLELVKATAQRNGVAVSPEDIRQERERTIDKMFEESNRKITDKINAALEKNKTAEADKLRADMRHDNEQAADQYLANQHISRAEFDIVVETNAYLRKIAEPMLKGKISDDNLKQAFAALYGETVQCRHIQCANLQEIAQAKQRLAAGEPFAKVAQEMSRNIATAPLGGMIRPFSLQWQGLPDAFKQAAFALKEGEVSDVVQAEGNYHLILLEKRIPPKAVKFEDVKESIRADLQQRAIDATVKELRQQLADQARANLQITDPTMKKQWDERIAKASAQIRDKEEMRKQWERERERAATQPVTGGGSDLSSPPPRLAAPAASAPTTQP
jgi:parvulin-like peptidyl-prolyl isomerase